MKEFAKFRELEDRDCC